MDKYGLIGYPLGHSFSISYFNQKFADEGINAKYENFEISSIDQLEEVLRKKYEFHLDMIYSKYYYIHMNNFDLHSNYRYIHFFQIYIVFSFY